MRVLYCTDTYPPQVNGVSVVTALSVSGLTARGWECAVVSPRYPSGAVSAFTTNPELERTTLPSVPLPIYPETRLSLPDAGAVDRAVARFHPDLVHCETEFIIGWLGQRAARRARIPVVSSYHTDFARYIAEYGLPGLRGVVSQYLARFHRRSRRTYTPSAPARAYLTELGVPDVEVWGRGVDTAAFNPNKRSAALRSELGLDGRVAFLYAGRLATEKGVDRIIGAYRQATSTLPPDATRLVIAGAGPQERSIRAAAPGDTAFLGYLDRGRTLPTLYASCDAFLFASHTETLGLVVLEAMASGLAVIAAPAGGVADHLRDGVNGIAYPPGDVAAMARAIRALVQDPALLIALAAGARATAAALSWERELDRLDASYRDVLERSPAHAM